MKKIKAFTLIELLAIIIVLTGIFSIVVPEINKALTNRRIKEFKEVAASIENTAKLYVSENYEVGVDEIPSYITLRDLTDENMVDAPLIDPRNGNQFDPDIVITIVEDEDGVLVYTFDDTNLLPTVEIATIVSNNSLNNKYAKNGDTVTLGITFNKSIANVPTITIGGRTPSITGTGKTRTVTYTVPTNESTLSEGTLPISISNYIDSGGITGNPRNTVTEGGNVTYDRTPPAFTYFYIGGAGNPAYIISRNVILHFSVSGASQMCINTVSTSCTSWETYAATKTYTITDPGDGIKTLYVWFRDAAGNTIGSYSDSVTLDTQGPGEGYFYIGGTGNPAYTTSTNTTLYFSTTDSNEVCINTVSTSCSTWDGYSATKPYTLATGDGIKTLYAWFRDVAGNQVGPYSDSITLDTVLPTVTAATIVSNNALDNKLAKNGDTVTLNITFSESISNTPTITIGGRSATSITGSGTTRIATYLMPANESTLAEGPLGINISAYNDAAGNTGSAHTTITTGGTVTYDRTGPVCVSSGGSATWRNTNLTITGTCSDAGGSGCTGNVTKIYSTDTNTTTASPGSVSDNAGNSTVCPGNQTVRIDKTAPTCSSSGGSATWINTNLTLTGTCSDATSGCVGNATKTYSTDINSTVESPGSVSDNAGNTATCPANQEVHIDKTGPVCVSSGGNSQWTNDSRTLTGTCSDAISGCVGNVTKTYSTEINSTTESPGSVTDNVGNSTVCPGNQIVRIDKTAPACNVSGGSTEWFNTNRTITGTCDDGVSPLSSSCPSSSISYTYTSDTDTTTAGPGAGGGDGTISDNAGNIATCPANQEVHIDKTGPVCVSSGGNSQWTDGSRTLTGTCTDAHGCTGNVTKVYSTQINSTTESPGTVSDTHGNTVMCPANQTVKIDTTNPICSSSGGSATWRNTNLTITGTCSDTGGSGCVGNVTKTYSTNTNTTTASPGSVSDNAGNTTTCPANQTVKIDTTDPTCSTSGGSSTWYNVSRTITITCSDTGGSGVDTCNGVGASSTTATYTGNSNGTWHYVVVDNAGNSNSGSPCGATVKIDKTDPTCTSSGESATWRNTNLTITGTCSDTGGSGCSGNVTKTYSTNTNTTVASPGSVSDNAGNSTACPANQTVKIDKTAPSSPSGNVLYYNGSGLYDFRAYCGTDTGGSGLPSNCIEYCSSSSCTPSLRTSDGSTHGGLPVFRFRTIDNAGNRSGTMEMP